MHDVGLRTAYVDVRRVDGSWSAVRGGIGVLGGTPAGIAVFPVPVLFFRFSQRSFSRRVSSGFRRFRCGFSD